MGVFAGGSSRRKKLDPPRASLSGEDLDLILFKRGHRNQLGFAASERKSARNSDSNPSRSRNTGIKTTNKLAIAFDIIVAISILSITLVYALLLQIGGGAASLDAKIQGVSVVLGGAFSAFVALYYVLFRSFKVLLSLIPVVVALIICAGTLVAVTPDTGQPYASKNDEEITALRA
jgi:hypothetical protein